jgi:hypothetical protein
MRYSLFYRIRGKTASLIRPLDRLRQQIKELSITVDINRHRVCFDTSRNHYQLGMSLFLAFPYSTLTLVRNECLAEVLRVDPLPNRRHAKVVQFPSRAKYD